VAESDGHIFFYLMGSSSFEASLTLSEAQVDPRQFSGAGCGPDGDFDPEDPRCAKLTISGTVSPCDGSSCDVGLEALLAAHPQMADWPEEHGFSVSEMMISENGLWMIASYGGGSVMNADDYYSSEAIHHSANGFGGHGRLRSSGSGNGFGINHKQLEEKVKQAQEVGSRPDFGDDAAGHARWLVAKSLWTTVTTISSRKSGETFGNIRSTADGTCFGSSTGLPYFYLPKPDPTMIDVLNNNNIALSFTEAALAERVDDNGIACGGMDAEDPTCAKITLMITLIGNAVALDDDQIVLAKEAFKVQHPRAEWLSSAGGAHTGGSYYTIDVHDIMFLRNYGGPTIVTPEEYVNWKPKSFEHFGEIKLDKM